MDKRHKLLLCNLILCACLFVFALVTIVMASSALTSKRRLIAALILVYFFAVAIISLILFLTARFYSKKPFALAGIVETAVVVLVWCFILIPLLADRSAVAASGISMELNIPWVFYVFTAASFLSSALCLAAAFAKEKREV